MNVATLLREVHQHGILLEARDGHLHYRAPKGALTPQLRRAVLAKRSDIITMLEEVGTEMLQLAADHGLTANELRQTAGQDWPEIKADPALARAFATAVEIRQMREQNRIPPSYTASTTCAGCGPVPIWPGCPENVLACPWCFNRIADRPVPRP